MRARAAGRRCRGRVPPGSAVQVPNTTRSRPRASSSLTSAAWPNAAAPGAGGHHPVAPPDSRAAAVAARPGTAPARTATLPSRKRLHGAPAGSGRAPASTITTGTGPGEVVERAADLLGDQHAARRRSRGTGRRAPPGARRSELSATGRPLWSRSVKSGAGSRTRAARRRRRQCPRCCSPPAGASSFCPAGGQRRHQREQPRAGPRPRAGRGVAGGRSRWHDSEGMTALGRAHPQRYTF